MSVDSGFDVVTRGPGDLLLSRLDAVAAGCTALGDRQNEVLHRFIGRLQGYVSTGCIMDLPQVIVELESVQRVVTSEQEVADV